MSKKIQPPKAKAAVAKKVESAKSEADVAVPRGPGRPLGSENRDYDIVDVQPSCCKKCGSTSRSDYEGRPDEHEQLTDTHINVTIWRRTRCLDCGQWRKDRSTCKRLISGTCDHS